MSAPAKDYTIRTTSRLIIFTSLLLFLLYWIFDLFHGEMIYWGLFIGLVDVLLLLALLLVRGVSLLERRNGKEAAPFLIGVLTIGFVFYQPDKYFIEMFKSPAIYSGACEHTVTMISLTLRADHTFEYNAGAFLKREIHVGRYEKAGDTITLSFEDDRPVNTRNKYLITKKGLEEFTEKKEGHRHFMMFVRPE